MLWSFIPSDRISGSSPAAQPSMCAPWRGDRRAARVAFVEASLARAANSRRGRRRSTRGLEGSRVPDRRVRPVTRIGLLACRRRTRSRSVTETISGLPAGHHYQRSRSTTSTTCSKAGRRATPSSVPARRRRLRADRVDPDVVTRDLGRPRGRPFPARPPRRRWRRQSAGVRDVVVFPGAAAGGRSGATRRNRCPRRRCWSTLPERFSSRAYRVSVRRGDADIGPSVRSRRRLPFGRRARCDLLATAHLRRGSCATRLDGAQPVGIAPRRPRPMRGGGTDHHGVVVPPR